MHPVLVLFANFVVNFFDAWVTTTWKNTEVKSSYAEVTGSHWKTELRVAHSFMFLRLLNF